MDFWSYMPSEGFPTFFTLIGFLTYVHSFVLLEGFLISKDFFHTVHIHRVSLWCDSFMYSKKTVISENSYIIYIYKVHLHCVLSCVA